MSQLQRIIVRMGLSADIPALKDAELGWDIDTKTLRIGNESPNPHKVMTTGSTGTFVFPFVTVKFGSLEADDINGVDFNSLTSDEGVLVSLGNGSFAGRAFTSNDGSVLITNGNGQNGNIDLSVSTETISGALVDIRNDLEAMTARIDQLSTEIDDNDDVVDNLILLSGRPRNSNSLGAFPAGSVIPDNVSIRTALEALDTAVSNLNGSNPAAIEIEIFDRTATDLKIRLSNGNLTTVPVATTTLSGLLPAADKTKLNRIILNNPVNLNLMLEDMQAINETLVEIEEELFDIDKTFPRYFVKPNPSTPLWASEETVTTGEITVGSMVAFVVEVNRVGDVNGDITYDEVTIDGKTILPSEITIHTKTSYLTLIKNNDRWFLLKDSMICELISSTTPLSFEIYSSNNSVRVFELQTI